MVNYKDIFKEDIRKATEINDGVEWVVPQSEGQIEEVLSVLASMGRQEPEPIDEHRV